MFTLICVGVGALAAVVGTGVGIYEKEKQLDLAKEQAADQKEQARKGAAVAMADDEKRARLTLQAAATGLLPKQLELHEDKLKLADKKHLQDVETPYQKVDVRQKVVVAAQGTAKEFFQGAPTHRLLGKPIAS